jgi:hypothetical protein
LVGILCLPMAVERVECLFQKTSCCPHSKQHWKNHTCLKR